MAHHHNVLITQVSISFVAWIGFGWLLAKFASRRREAILRMKRAMRVTLGPLLMLLGAAVLLVGFRILAVTNGLTPTGLTPLGWAILNVVGLVFVGAQVLATILMVSLVTESEPRGIAQTSDRRINE